MQYHRAIIERPFKGHYQSLTVIDEQGKEIVLYSDGKTIEEYLKERPTMEAVTMEEADKLIDNFHNSMVTDWQEISEERYYDMLEVLPPCKYENGKFHVSERITGDLVSWFKCDGGKFYEKTDYSTEEAA